MIIVISGRSKTKTNVCRTKIHISQQLIVLVKIQYKYRDYFLPNSTQQYTLKYRPQQKKSLKLRTFRHCVELQQKNLHFCRPLSIGNADIVFKNTKLEFFGASFLLNICGTEYCMNMYMSCFSIRWCNIYEMKLQDHPSA